MGLFDFVAEAGEKLAGKVLGRCRRGHQQKPWKYHPAGHELRQQNIAHSVAQLDVAGEKVAVKVDGDTAVLRTTCARRLNQYGIARVDCRLQDCIAARRRIDLYTVQPAISADRPAALGANKYTDLRERTNRMLKDRTRFTSRACGFPRCKSRTFPADYRESGWRQRMRVLPRARLYVGFFAVAAGVQVCCAPVSIQQNNKFST